MVSQAWPRSRSAASSSAWNSGRSGEIRAARALPWIAARAVRDLDAFYDRAQGGWGRRQKLPLGRNVLVELRRAMQTATDAPRSERRCKPATEFTRRYSATTCTA